MGPGKNRAPCTRESRDADLKFNAMTTDVKRQIKKRVEHLTGDTLKSTIFHIAKVPFILLIYENNFEAEAHKNEMFFLLRVMEFLIEVEKE